MTPSLLPWRLCSRCACGAIVFSIMLCLQGCGIPMGFDTWLQTKRYSGDGSIETCSNMFSPGYMITLPEFDAGHSYRITYRLSNVPPNSEMFYKRDPYIYLCFLWKRGSVDSDWVKNTTTASIKATLSKQTGQIVRSFELPLSSMLWGETQDVHELWDYEKTKLYFEARTSYLLNIEYRPGSVPPPTTRLFFAIKDCASY